MPVHITQNFRYQCHELLQKVISAKDQNKKIIYLDETVFSKLSLLNKEWSPKIVTFLLILVKCIQDIDVP